MWQEIYDKSFTSMEKSHQKVLMQMRRAHKRELDAMRQEKEQELDEETKATQAALDAMRKAHERELQSERSKFLDMLAKTYSHAELESIQRQHEYVNNSPFLCHFLASVYMYSHNNLKQAFNVWHLNILKLYKQVEIIWCLSKT